MPSGPKSKNAGKLADHRRITLSVAVLAVAAAITTVVVVLATRETRGPGDEATVAPTPIHTFSTADQHALTFSPNEPGVILFGHHDGVQISKDGGQTWQVLVERPGLDAMNLAYDPFSPMTIYLAGHDTFEVSDDNGITWKPLTSNLPSMDIHAFVASSEQQGKFLAFIFGKGLFVSEGGAENWRLVSRNAAQHPASLVQLPTGALLLASPGDGILKSKDGGKSWSRSAAGIDTLLVFTLKDDPKGKRLYAGTGEGLFASTNGGKSWEETRLNSRAVTAVGVNPRNPLEVLAVTRDGNLFRSLDGGQRWQF